MDGTLSHRLTLGSMNQETSPSPLALQDVQMRVAIAVLTGNLTPLQGAELLGIRLSEMQELARTWDEVLNFPVEEGVSATSTNTSC